MKIYTHVKPVGRVKIEAIQNIGSKVSILGVPGVVVEPGGAALQHHVLLLGDGVQVVGALLRALALHIQLPLLNPGPGLNILPKMRKKEQKMLK